MKTRNMNALAFSSMPSPVTCMAYDEPHDTLYVGTWSAVVTLKNLTVGKIKQSTAK